jgi:predicted adenylyl cyclase CyaB
MESAQNFDSTPNGRARRNIELKARIGSIDEARLVCARLGTQGPVFEEQVDTYFRCRHGRLKLRERQGSEAQLVSYVRPNAQAAKASDYYLVGVADAKELLHALAAALGVEVVVAKRREIYMWHQVRIHLDQVRNLGDFLEFEAVLQPGIDDANGHEQIATLSRDFRIDPSDLVDCSYSDLLLVGRQ